jgi:hypothetical protein
MLKCWQELSWYKQFVLENWHSYQITGWGGFVLREKLKLIKSALKEWHSLHVRNIPGKIVALKNRLSKLDEDGEDGGLSSDEV